MSFISGEDGTNKNDGYITFNTESDASNGNVNAIERVKISSTGQFIVGTNPTVNSGNIAHIEAPTSFNNGETIVVIAGNANSAGPRLSLQNLNTGANASSEILGTDAGGQSTGSIRFYHTDQSNNYGDLALGTRNAAGPPVDRMRITKGGQVNIGGDYTQTTYKTQIETTNGNVLRLVTDSDDANGVELVLRKDSASPADEDNIGNIYFQGNDDSGAQTFYASMEAYSSDVSNNSEDGYIRFRTRDDGTMAERLRITSGGVLCTGNYSTLLDTTSGSIQINGDTSGGRLSFRGTSTSAYAGLGEIHGFWDTNKVASILFHAGSDTSNKDDGEIRMYTRPSGGNAAQRFRIDANGNVIFGSAGTYASNSVSIHPSSGMVNFGMDGRDALITGENSCYIFSGAGASGDMPAGTLIIQSRANVNRNILFATGATPSRKWLIHGSTGALQEFPYNTSTSAQSTGNGQAYHLRRMRNGQVPTMNSGSTYTLFNTNDIGDSGAYIIIIRSFEQSVTGGVLWSVRVVSSVFYLHSGSGNDGETVNIPVTHSGHANNASNPPVTLKIHFYGGSAHTHGRISITPNGFNYTGTNCDYYVYKLIDV